MESKYVELPSGLPVHMLEAGTQENPPLVLLHGYPADGRVWRNCIPDLAGAYHVFAPDLPGHGQSGKPLDVCYDLIFFLNFLQDYLTALDLDEVDLVCHDLGALAGLSLAFHHPEKVKRLVVMDTGPYADWPFMARLLIRIMKNRLLTPLLLNRFVFTLLFRHLVFRDPALATRERIALFRDPWVQDQNSRKAFRRTIDAPLEQMALSEEQLRNLRVPTLILWAGNDAFFPLSVAKRLQRDIPGAGLRVVPDSGHFLQEEKPQAVTDHVISFLRGGPAEIFCDKSLPAHSGCR